MIRRSLAGTMLAAAIALGAGSGRAQTIVLDEGTFRVLVDGLEAGMETFSIRQNGTGAEAVVIARGRVVVDTGAGSQEVQASVQLAGPGLRPVAYDVEVRGRTAQRVNARISGSRANARISSPAGENMREYLVSEGAVLVDQAVAHHYFFLARRAAAGGANVPIVEPRTSRQSFTRVSLVGKGTVTVGGSELAATHYLVGSAGDGVHVWADAQGRVLKLEVPGRQYAAIRTAPPGA